MKKKIIPLLLFFVASHLPHAVSADDLDAAVVDTQETPADIYVPLVQNYPSFTVEFLRMDYLCNLDSKASGSFHNMKKFDWHSLYRGNGAILYAIRINKSRFAFCPGIGWSSLYYVFAGREDKGNGNGKVYQRLKRESKSSTKCEDIGNKPDREVLRSAVKIPFIDLLLRLRFNSVLEDPKAGFHAWLGAKFGLHRSASMMIDYKEYGELGASSVYEGSFSLKAYAWAFQAGIGYHRFGVTGGFQLTSLFKKGEGPVNSDSLRPFSFGIYVDLI